MINDGLLCEFTSGDKGSRCVHCGYALRRSFPRHPTRPCSGPKSSSDGCPHFLGATQPAETVLVFGCVACPGKQGIAKTVCECALDSHPRCVLFGGGTHLSDATVQRCVTCKDNPKLSPPLPNPIAERQNQPDDERHD